MPSRPRAPSARAVTEPAGELGSLWADQAEAVPAKRRTSAGPGSGDQGAAQACTTSGSTGRHAGCDANRLGISGLLVQERTSRAIDSEASRTLAGDAVAEVFFQQPERH